MHRQFTTEGRMADQGTAIGMEGKIWYTLDKWIFKHVLGMERMRGIHGNVSYFNCGR